MGGELGQGTGRDGGTAPSAPPSERRPDREMQLHTPPIAGGEVVDRSAGREGGDNVVRVAEVERRGVQLVAHRDLNGADYGLVAEPDAGPEEELVLVELARVEREALVGGPDLSAIEERVGIPLVTQTGNRG